MNFSTEFHGTFTFSSLCNGLTCSLCIYTRFTKMWFPRWCGFQSHTCHKTLVDELLCHLGGNMPHMMMELVQDKDLSCRICQFGLMCDLINATTCLWDSTNVLPFWPLNCALAISKCH